MGEKAIATSSEFSYEYAYLINKPFLLGEPAIAKNAWWVIQYAKEILKGRFELGEPTIKFHHHRNLYTDAMKKLKTPVNWNEVKNPY